MALIRTLGVLLLCLGCGGSHVGVRPDEPSSKDPALPDHSDPASVVQAIFYAAQSGDAQYLPGLCDPLGDGDGDTRDICGVAPGDKHWAEFESYFVLGEIQGAPRVAGTAAEVDFLFGPDGTRKETMKLIQRDGKWYLYSF